MSFDRSLFSIRSVSAERVFPLRSTILLDGNTEASHFRGDRETSTLHLAVYEEDAIVAVATVCQEAFPGSPGDTAWRLRGVAVEPKWQGYGLGRLMIKLCIDHAQHNGGRLVWCTARESARGFYDSIGFASSSPPFTLPSRAGVLFYEMHYVLPGKPAPDVE
ncbi:hypothetical protein BWP39_30610 [Paraburkholderia acidicola]|uniref:GNAT family N-acetyltransferase n=1 Tax=Paraburkholderia acidicola TaxID=1912599 RepID=A0A2A4ETM0_9BURK|nr:GNAT family N-acetyltransferase [Paraburkholderia acidicola]PCE24037.1 hypothetical protein BWP39_30610 [Paraburkholderia acidicola]